VVRFDLQGATFISSPDVLKGSGALASTSRVKRPRLEVDHSSVSRADVKDEWRYSFTSQYTLIRCTGIW
jgi:hypothetical protein